MSTAIAPTPTSFDLEAYNAKMFAGGRTPSSTMDQNSFLQLLVTQMTNQDPTSPMSNNDFAQQLTSFSSLDASQKMQSDMSWLVSSSLIGSTVDVLPANSKTPLTGVVSEVVLMDGVPQIIVNGQNYKLSQIQNVKPYSPETNPIAQH